MITDTGLETLKQWILTGTGSPPTHIGVGLGTTAPFQTDAALANEVYPTTSRNPVIVTRSEAVINFRMNMGTAEGSTATYAEQGLFTNSTTGTMFSRLTHPDTDKSNKVVMDSIISLEVGSYLP